MTFRSSPKDPGAIDADLYEHIRRLEKQFVTIPGFDICKQDAAGYNINCPDDFCVYVGEDIKFDIGTTFSIVAPVETSINTGNFDLDASSALIDITGGVVENIGGSYDWNIIGSLDLEVGDNLDISAGDNSSINIDGAFSIKAGDISGSPWQDISISGDNLSLEARGVGSSATLASDDGPVILDWDSYGYLTSPNMDKWLYQASPPTAPVLADFNAGPGGWSSVVFWLDEANDKLKAVARESIAAGGAILTFDLGSSGGSSWDGVAVEDEGAAQGDAFMLDFVGAGVTASVAGGVATVTIPGGGGGGGTPGSPVETQFGDVGADGVSADYARADHLHDRHDDAILHYVGVNL